MEETYRKELGLMKWLFRLTERLTILTTSMRMKTDLGITEEDVEIIRALHRIKELGYVPMYETFMVNKDDTSQSVTKVDLFNDKTGVVSRTDAIGTEIDMPPIETIKKKKK